MATAHRYVTETLKVLTALAPALKPWRLLRKLRCSSEAEGTWYVVEIHFRAADGELYSVAAMHADNQDLTLERWVANTAARYFCPPETDCGSWEGRAG
ncbi:hypothetical protein ODJ75_18745 [Streptomyces sp. HB2AG]|nr:hypothetical protein [Streptomyces sp. HB2AG]MCZ2526669.1 hypothetical protein [Streptomyces sp. HB2AG]